MNESDAISELGEADLISFRSGSIPDMKQLRDRCLAEGVPVTVGCPPSTGKSWGTKIHLLVREVDLNRVAHVLASEWGELLAREGTLSAAPALAMSADGELPCPACGTAAPLVDGCCSDCGLNLE